MFWENNNVSIENYAGFSVCLTPLQTPLAQHLQMLKHCNERCTQNPHYTTSCASYFANNIQTLKAASLLIKNLKVIFLHCNIHDMK